MPTTPPPTMPITTRGLGGLNDYRRPDVGQTGGMFDSERRLYLQHNGYTMAMRASDAAIQGIAAIDGCSDAASSAKYVQQCDGTRCSISQVDERGLGLRTSFSSIP